MATKTAAFLLILRFISLFSLRALVMIFSLFLFMMKTVKQVFPDNLAFFDDFS